VVVAPIASARVGVQSAFCSTFISSVGVVVKRFFSENAAESEIIMH